MIKDILNVVMAGTVAFSFPQLTVGLLNGAQMLSASEQVSLSEIHDIAQGALSGDPQKLAQLCPALKSLADMAGPEAADIAHLCDALAKGGSPDQVMAIATRALDNLQVASR